MSGAPLIRFAPKVDRKQALTALFDFAPSPVSRPPSLVKSPKSQVPSPKSVPSHSQPPSASSESSAVQHPPVPSASVPAAKPPGTSPSPNVTAVKSLDVKLPKAVKILIPVSALVLGLVVVAFAASRPAEEAREPINVTLDEGEARMVTIPFKAGTEPSFEIRGGDAAVVDTAVFLAQKDRGLVHVLVTAAGPGETTWAMGPRAYRVQVRAATARTGGGDADRAAALKKMEEGELLERESQRDLSNTFHAMMCFRQAVALLRSIEFGTHDETYRKAGARHEQLSRAWAELYARAEGELAIARMNGDTKAIRRALNALMAIAPDPKSPEYQKNTTIANYVYAEKKKEEQP